jgi:ribosomal protein L11 methyltransferase
LPSFALTVEVAEEVAEETAALLVELGASGVEERDGSIAPMPGAARPAPGRALLVAFFADRGGAERAAVELSLDGRIAGVPDRDWGESWKEGLRPFAVGRTFVRPSWIAAAPPPGAVEVVLDPGMAFGTGTHPTTALCLGALGEIAAARPGLSVLDVGTGSGLLAIAARKLGAGRVVGSDDDPEALRVARENAERNGVVLELTSADVREIPGPFDLVMANILANTLVELAPALSAQVARAGVLLLSGILEGQEEDVRRPFLGAGLGAGEVRRQAGWSLLAFRRGP